MTTSPNLPTDMLIHAARCAVDCYEHVADRLSDHGVCDNLPDETDWLEDRMSTLRLAAREFSHYSDGRPVSACEVIDTGVHIHHVFPAIVEHRGERLLFTDRRLSDPDQPDRGHYRVYADDAAATLRVELYGPLELV